MLGRQHATRCAQRRVRDRAAAARSAPSLRAPRSHGHATRVAMAVAGPMARPSNAVWRSNTPQPIKRICGT